MKYYVKFTGYCNSYFGTIGVEADSWEEAVQKAKDVYMSKFDVEKGEPRYAYKMEQDNGNYRISDFEDIEYINGCIHTGHDVTTYRADITNMDIGDVDELYDQDEDIEWEAINAYKA